MAANVRESTSGSNVDGVSFECNVCFELPHEPIVMLCGHLFCWPCLYKWLHIHSHSTECPVCKAVVEEAKLIPLYGRGKDRVDPRSKNNVPGGAADIPDRRPAMSLKADTNRTEMKNRMGKRKEEDMSSDHPDDDEEAAKTVMYLVLEHAVEEPAYSVFRVDAAASIEDDDGSRRARHLVRIPASQHSMSFAAVYSKRGRSWIVGVGGDTTIYYNPTQEGRGFEQGPRPTSAKRDPVLISHGRKLFSFSRRYKVDPDAGYEPWFEYLSVGEEGPGSGFWMDLLVPPFPPFVLTPRQYLDPPEIRVLAYAAVGSYILLSLEPGGTFAFHVRKVTWAKVDEKNLPFVGDAVPLGGNYFASRSRARCGATAVFYLKLNKVHDATSSEPARLSVQEFPVDIIAGGGQQLLCPLGPGEGGSFCSVNLMSSCHSSRQPGMLKTAQVVVTTCQMNVKGETMNVKGETAELQVLVNDEQRQIYRFCDRTRFLASPMPLVAALSMDRRSIEENPRKKMAAPHICGAPMFTTETSK